VTARALAVRAVVLPDGESREFFVVDGLITFDNPHYLDVETLADHGFALPGLVDAHCHVGLTATGGAPIDVAREHAITDRDAGALLLRDAGVPETYYALDDEPELPRIVHAGRHLARPRRYIRGYALELEPAQLPDAAAFQAVRPGGASTPWVKIVGDWIDRDIGDITPLWSTDVLFEAVRRAHDAGARVGVHVFGEEALPDLIAAGVDSIEHGTMLRVSQFDDFANQATKYPMYADRMRRLKRTAAARMMATFDAGVPIYVGTDAGGHLPHGLAVDEMLAMHGAGMPTIDVLGAGSWKAREWLGLPGIVEGAPADFVVYDADPRLDLAALRDPRHIVVRGNVVL
jgi:imidazolonepropionase-like amidohydrolase